MVVHVGVLSPFSSPCPKGFSGFNVVPPTGSVIRPLVSLSVEHKPLVYTLTYEEHAYTYTLKTQSRTRLLHYILRKAKLIQDHQSGLVAEVVYVIVASVKYQSSIHKKVPNLTFPRNLNQTHYVARVFVKSYFFQSMLLPQYDGREEKCYSCGPPTSYIQVNHSYRPFC